MWTIIIRCRYLRKTNKCADLKSWKINQLINYATSICTFSRKLWQWNDKLILKVFMCGTHVHVRARERKAKCRLNHFYNITRERGKKITLNIFIYWFLHYVLQTVKWQCMSWDLSHTSHQPPRNARIDNNYRASDMQVCCRLLLPCPGLSRNLASDTRHQQPVIRTSLLDTILPVQGRSSSPPPLIW